ncbi:MAG: hypothetical protein A2177_01855 [Spirochaetes bacterium RBG_13_68_11]|nr:MAG: hypothetical protein A2177_01855 [Spirochaetes bacterium RBG_13_68_11]
MENILLEAQYFFSLSIQLVGKPVDDLQIPSISLVALEYIKIGFYRLFDECRPSILPFYVGIYELQKII